MKGSCLHIAVGYRWSPKKPSRTNTKKRYPFHYRGLECKRGKSRNTWSNRQIWPWNTEWSRARLIEFCQENARVIANTLFQQHKRRLYTWISSDGQCQNEMDYTLQPKMEKLSTVRKNKSRSWLWLRSWTPIAKFRLKLKKVGKITRPLKMKLLSYVRLFATP